MRGSGNCDNRSTPKALGPLSSDPSQCFFVFLVSICMKGSCQFLYKSVYRSATFITLCKCWKKSINGLKL